jgi:hypothetical protein
MNKREKCVPVEKFVLKRTKAAHSLSSLHSDGSDKGQNDEASIQTIFDTVSNSSSSVKLSFITALKSSDLLEKLAFNSDKKSNKSSQINLHESVHSDSGIHSLLENVHEVSNSIPAKETNKIISDPLDSIINETNVTLEKSSWIKSKSAVIPRSLDSQPEISKLPSLKAATTTPASKTPIDLREHEKLKISVTSHARNQRFEITSDENDLDYLINKSNTISVNTVKKVNFQPVIALREYELDDSSFNSAIEILVHVSQPCFRKIFIVRKLDDPAKLKDFCCDFNAVKRSKLFQLNDSRAKKPIQVRKLKLNELKELCGNQHVSDMKDDSDDDDNLIDLREERFTIQQIRRVDSGTVESFFKALDIQVEEDRDDLTNFNILKK